MEKFVFEYTVENEFGSSNVNRMEINGNAITHPHIAERLNEFLRGCGFVFNGEYTLNDEK